MQGRHGEFLRREGAGDTAIAAATLSRPVAAGDTAMAAATLSRPVAAGDTAIAAATLNHPVAAATAADPVVVHRRTPAVRDTDAKAAAPQRLLPPANSRWQRRSAYCTSTLSFKS